MDYATAGPKAGSVANAELPAKLELQAAAPRTLRGEGSALIDPLHPERNIQIPMKVPAVGPNGEPGFKLVQPLENSTGGAAGNSTATGGNTAGGGGFTPQGLAPGTLHMIDELATKFGSDGARQYSSANATLGWAEQMQHAADVLNSGGGWSVTGATNPARMEFAKIINTASQVLGIDPPFDPQKVASWEEFTKQTKTAGMQLVNSMFGGSREAASIINGATSAIANSENTPIGGQLVLNGIVEVSKNVMDKRIFETNWALAHGGNLIGAEEAFNQKYPPYMYTRRAISQVQPYEVPTPQDALKAYLPGTHVRTPDGRVLTVPGEPNLTLTGATQ